MKAWGVILLVPSVALAAPQRGWVTGAGLGVAGAGIVVVSLGAYDAAQGEAARKAIAAYYAHGAAPTVAEAPAVRWLQERSESMGTRGLALLIAGAAAFVVGIGLVAFDGWVSVSVTPDRAEVALRGTF